MRAAAAAAAGVPVADAPPPPEASTLRVEVLDKMTGFMTAAFGLVAALAWNSAIQDLFAQYFPPGSGLGPKFLYALLVTLLAVGVIVYISRLSGHAKQTLTAPRRRA